MFALRVHVRAPAVGADGEVRPRSCKSDAEAVGTRLLAGELPAEASAVRLVRVATVVVILVADDDCVARYSDAFAEGIGAECGVSQIAVGHRAFGNRGP